MSHSPDTGVWYIYGAGGLGAETADILVEAIAEAGGGVWEIRFLVDKRSSDIVGEFEVTSFSDCQKGARFTVAVGEPAVRQKLYEKGQSAGLIPSRIISPKAYVSATALIGDGAVIAPFASIQARAIVGQNVSVNTQAIVGHDVHIGDGAVVSSQVNCGGASRIGSSSYIGMGSLIKENIEIGQWSIIGMGSVVYKDISDEVIALGNPARVAKRNDDRRVF